MSELKPTIGLEIHIHLLTGTKAFCGCKAHFGDAPNSNVCPVCMGYPGALPALNERGIFLGYKTAKALGCALEKNSIFERKSYYYPDMPKNYQISQFAQPLGTNGIFEFESSGARKKVRIHECHFEEDAGKMIHAGDMTLLDYNRAGYPLLEIVTEPDLHTGEEAEDFIQSLRRLVRHLGVCDGNMEEGSLRCDANVSLAPEGAPLGVKVEIKNLNSSRFVRKALGYEIERQNKAIAQGKTIIQETRLWNENRDVTESMRKKESSHDYRFFPEPDLPPFRPDAAFMARVDAEQVELPLARRDRYARAHGLSAEQAEFVSEERDVAEYFEKAIALGADAKTAAAWLSGDVKAQLNRSGGKLSECPLSAERLASLLKLLASGRIHAKIAKQALQAVFDEDADPEAVIKAKGWELLGAGPELDAMVAEAFAADAKSVAAVLGGNDKAMLALIGAVMKKSSGRAEPGALRASVEAKLASLRGK